MSSLIPLPTGSPAKIPSIQYKFKSDSWTITEQEQKKRRESARETFLRAWNGYREHTWLTDELTPISGGSRDHFGGRGAILVDALDTLCMDHGFEDGV